MVYINDIDKKIKALMKNTNVSIRKKERAKLNNIKKTKRLKIEKLKKEIALIDFFKKIESMPKQIPIWICGFSKHGALHPVTGIPGPLNFGGGTLSSGEEYVNYKYTVCVSKMRNSDKDWVSFAKKL